MIEKTILTLPSSLYNKKATFFHNFSIPMKGCILYFHGGGLFFGSRNDLPQLHITTLTDNGYSILAFDYPLAPEAQIQTILDDVSASIDYYITEFDLIDTNTIPYFLWGRSAGAYLTMLVTAKYTFNKPPSGVLSYYGYGFLTDSWYSTPSPTYTQLPAISENSFISDGVIRGEKNITKYMKFYIAARQSGDWISRIFEGKEKHFFLEYSLKLVDSFPCPLFCTHATGDPDVPYSEFMALTQKYRATTFIVSSDIHDFDRLEEKRTTAQLLEATLQFLRLQGNEI